MMKLKFDRGGRVGINVILRSSLGFWVYEVSLLGGGTNIHFFSKLWLGKAILKLKIPDKFELWCCRRGDLEHSYEKLSCF
jgi:hypothetical protein